MPYLCGMLTKYTITIDGNETLIPEECLKNWDEISFSLKRTDYSGVMRSFSTSFEFCGDIAEMLFGEYLNKGFTATAGVAVYTITNRHTWEKQFEAPLDFSSLSYEHGILSINALDSTLAALIKNNKGTKYEFAMQDFGAGVTNALMRKMKIKNRGVFTLRGEGQSSDDRGSVSAYISTDETLTKDLFELTNESNANEFFVKCNSTFAELDVYFSINAVCPLSASYYDSSLNPADSVPYMRLLLKVDDGESEPSFQKLTVNIADNDIRSKQVGGSLDIVAFSLEELMSWRPNPEKLDFGVVGSFSDPYDSRYWSSNTIYEWNGSAWVIKGTPQNYTQTKEITNTVNISDRYLGPGYHVGVFMECVRTDLQWMMTGGFTASWNDVFTGDLYAMAFRPESLINALVKRISPTASAEIESSGTDLIDSTWLVPGECLRSISNPKAYTTFNDFAGWMSSFFGYTYTINNNKVVFMPRSSVFSDNVSKVLTSVKNVQFSVDDKLIYAKVVAGQETVEYDSVNGRDQWFLNEYSTGLSITENSLTLTSRYRSDCYGIELTMRTAKKETTDNKADEKMFFMHLGHETPGGPLTVTTAVEVDGVLNDDVYGAEYTALQCISANADFIGCAHVPMTLTKTSVSGNSRLVVDGENINNNITIADRLFTAGVISLETDDMVIPSDLNGIIEFTHQGYKYSCYIGEAKAKFGRVNGMDYTLIVKDITEI